MPTRGRLYRFTTPGGDVEISAEAVSGKLLTKLVRLAGVLVAAGLVVLVGRYARRGGFAWLIGPIGSTVMIVLGAVALITGFAISGLILTVVGIALVVRRTLHKRSAAQAAATTP